MGRTTSRAVVPLPDFSAYAVIPAFPAAGLIERNASRYRGGFTPSERGLYRMITFCLPRTEDQSHWHAVARGTQKTHAQRVSAAGGQGGWASAPHTKGFPRYTAGSRAVSRPAAGDQALRFIRWSRSVSQTAPYLAQYSSAAAGDRPGAPATPV
ncbi:hypothetical protein SKAU_G00036670 [Synaphobranchus kaupii]|uniref:Uncharacterized protein n=1 Tax=Synaphobranchus kaupii TaxID=118154 RepID=A0A9Q1JHB0_SYNKA|nr:hypothetical protein SKAU_G00036670 [Synaphobranchus kaupii]